ncbi:MAG TPA: Rieske 2Fe-2S domain-containing protein [Pirellulaceae bacterium]|nr:Rieske 2Fe-2S domain-containing protein [Pirellulaceae bacterium]
MAEWLPVPDASNLPPGGRKLCELAGRRIALLRVGESLVAINNHCPHRGGPIGAGPVEGTTIMCPWHGLKFDLLSGECAESPSHCLERLEVKRDGEQVLVNVATETTPRNEQIHRYLVRYGVPGHVGRFGSIRRLSCRRGDGVIVLTDRGQESGEVLISEGDNGKSPAGEVLRMMTPEDQLQAAEHNKHVATLLVDVRTQLNELWPGLVVLDAEITFDGEVLILYHAAEASETLGPLAVKLAAAAGERRVQFETWNGDLSRKTASAAARGGTNDKDDEMRGPHERLKYDFRRVWECPVCHHRERTPGSVTSQICGCQAKETLLKQVAMKLVDDGPRRVDGKVLPQRKSTLP